MVREDFLLEIGCEELPARQIPILIQALAQGLKEALAKAQLNFDSFALFSTPRRLAILVKQLDTMQPDRAIEKKGPAVLTAFDNDKKPTPALLGFAKSCGVEYQQLENKQTDKGNFYYFISTQQGQKANDLLPQILEQVVAKLPITKRMRWGSNTTEFLRPVRWVVMLLGEQVISGTLLGLPAGRVTYGHRFHHPQAIEITNANQYEALLREKGCVIADANLRKSLIQKQVIEIAQKKNGKPIISEDLLTEVTGLVEWPVALIPHFDEKFLVVPKEALISSMQDHQKCFAIESEDGALLPYFVTVSNIQSTHENEVIKGNERVMRARLSDAQFFYYNDLKTHLSDNLSILKSVIFQTKLGNMFERSERIAKLSAFIAEQLGEKKEEAYRAGLLCKADLVSQMVGEFPELQGVMGYCYALNSKESSDVAVAIKEHYAPSYSGAPIPSTRMGSIIAIADKIDILIGIFGISQIPTGEKDPFGLRRAAVGLLRIMIEKELPLDLFQLLTIASQNYINPLPNTQVVEESFDFIMERLRAFYADQNVNADVFASVMAKKATQPYDFHRRILAVSYFKILPEATSLAAANKRVSNILSKQGEGINNQDIDKALLKIGAEKILADQLEKQKCKLAFLVAQGDYQEALCQLASLRPAVDAFFDEVMVMDENESLRNNRLAILMQLRELFLNVADIAMLVEEKINVEVDCS